MHRSMSESYISIDFFQILRLDHSMCIDTRLQFGGLPNFQKRVKKCDPKQPEPYIARLAAESAEYEESDEDEDDGAQEEEDDDNQDNEDGDEVAEKVD